MQKRPSSRASRSARCRRASTALARHTLRAAAQYEARPSAVLALLHRALREARDDGRFCTVAFCRFEPAGEGVRMHLSCGGHPLPLVLRRSGAWARCSAPTSSRCSTT